MGSGESGTKQTSRPQDVIRFGALKFDVVLPVGCATFGIRGAPMGEGPNDALPLRCPCCFCKTLSERSRYDICEVCFWEDDGQDDGDADEYWGGPNGSLTLSEARANFLRFGACEESMFGNVRPPRPDELPL